jgi:hypothetical protein
MNAQKRFWRMVRIVARDSAIASGTARRSPRMSVVLNSLRLRKARLD